VRCAACKRDLRGENHLDSNANNDGRTYVLCSSCFDKETTVVDAASTDNVWLVLTTRYSNREPFDILGCLETRRKS
jgi:hypothetical protein